MMKKVVVVSLFVLFFSLFLVSVSYADSAEVLPKGRFRVGVDGKFYFPIDERYDDDGHTEDIAADYNATLDSSVFRGLRDVEIAFGMPPGSASIGDSVVSLEYDVTTVEFSFQYAITDRLTVGIMIPYWDFENHVRARLETSNATVGKSAIGVGFGAPLVPIAGGGPFGDAVPLTTEDIQNLIGIGLDVNGDGTMDIPGFGYKPVKSWSESGLSDIEAR